MSVTQLVTTPARGVREGAARTRRAGTALTELVTTPVRTAREGAARNAQRRERRSFPGGLDRPQTGCTPHVVIWRKDRATLRHYTGATSGRAVLLVPSLINRSHIWDLRPGDSFVEGLLALGYDVYLVDWGTPTSATPRTRCPPTSTTTSPKQSRLYGKRPGPSRSSWATASAG